MIETMLNKLKVESLWFAINYYKNLYWLIIDISTTRFLITSIWLAFEGVCWIHSRIKIQLKLTLKFHKESLNVHSNHTHVWNYTWYKNEISSTCGVAFLCFIRVYFFFFAASSAANDFWSLMILSESNFNPTKLSRLFLYFYYTSSSYFVYIFKWILF